MKESNLPSHYALKNGELSVFDDIVLGKKVTVEKSFSEEDIQTFLQLSGDNNPVHLNEEFAKKTMFKGRVAYGLLSLMLISAGLTKLMGPGNIWLSQEFKFVNPIRINDTITATLEILDISENKTCTVLTTCVNQANKIVLEGKAQSRIFPIKSK